jgi:hypothetical protein
VRLSFFCPYPLISGAIHSASLAPARVMRWQAATFTPRPAAVMLVTEARDR